jgi:hypothetical protein
MALTLENFENVIDPEILERGWQYYQSGHVRNLTEENDTEWTARVRGTVNYEVVIEQAAGGELECECTCPYEWGPYCKHVAAVLYAIREQPGERTETKARPAKAPKQKAKDRLRSILEGVSREALIAILAEQFEKDEAFANRVLTQYSEEIPHKSVYARRVRESLKAGRGEYGFIDYWGASTAVADIHEMLDEADTLLASGKAHKTVPMLQAIIEGLVPALQDADDSNGEIGGAIEETFERLERAAELLPAAEKRGFLSYCLAEAFQEKYAGWDWKWDWLRVAGKLVGSQQERNEVFQALDRMAGQRPTGAEFMAGYDKEVAAHIKLTVIEREDGPQKALEFMVQHQSMEGIQQRLVQYYLDQGKLAEAKKVCEEALWQLEVRAPRHLHRHVYEQFLLAIAQREGDTQEIIRKTKALFMSGGDFHYYDLLKQTVRPAEWPLVVQELIQDLAKTRNDWGPGPYYLPEIYAREGMWDKLLEMVRQERISLLEHYRKPLEERYPAEICALYEQAIYRNMVTSSSRKVYQEVCQYIIRMKKLGQPERANQIIRELQAKYPKRRALMEELEKAR